MPTNKRPTPADGFPFKATGYGATHTVNPAGSKQIRRYFKIKNGFKTSAEGAMKWWKTYGWSVTTPAGLK